MLCGSGFCVVYVMSGLRFVFLGFVMNPNKVIDETIRVYALGAKLGWNGIMCVL